jgi:predicted peptidase
VQPYQNEYSFEDLKCLLYVPKDYPGEPGRKWPLILYFHGAGQMGDDPNVLREECLNFQLDNDKKEVFPFIVVSPQNPGEPMRLDRAAWWPDEVLAKVDRLLDHLLDTLSIDPSRIYCTGASMGGFGVWKMAMKYPNRFAAISPQCGEGDPGKVAAIKHIPTWVFHGDSDEIMPVENSRGMVKALKRWGGNVRYTEFAGGSHETCYANPYAELYPWLLEHTTAARA